MHLFNRIFAFVCDKMLQEEEIEKRKNAEIPPAQMEAEMQELKRENSDMKQYVLALQGEVYGARLAAKYLDKELAGRYDIYLIYVMSRIGVNRWKGNLASSSEG